MSEPRFHGVWVPVLTPFEDDLSVSRELFVEHCLWLLQQGADGLAVFGTTSEANSLSLDERMALLEAVVEAGVPAARLMPGTGCCALPDTVRLCRHALEHGCRAVLMLPPFYYKGVSDDGLFAAYSQVIEQAESPELKVFLYHIPPVAQVPVSPDLVARLLSAHPEQIAGIKDSGGDWGYTRVLLERFPNLAIFAGSERFLLKTLRRGGAGCITASGNINPAGIRVVYEQWEQDAAAGDAAQDRITALRNALERHAMIPALKAFCAGHYDEERWLNVRPPLVSQPETESAQLLREVNALGFSMCDNQRFTNGMRT